MTPALPVVSMEVMNTNFEEWMKLATDNVSSECLKSLTRAENHGHQYLELCLDRLLCRFDSAAE